MKKITACILGLLCCGALMTFAFSTLTLRNDSDLDLSCQTGGGGANCLTDDPAFIQTYAYPYETKTYEECFEDYGIPRTLAEIDQTTILGDGSKGNPYIINSTTDFIFLTQFNSNGFHAYLNCDVFLNDETFDDEGNPYGGDGVYYQWIGHNWQNGVFDGQGHTIYGLYINNTKAKQTGLFSKFSGTLNNLNVDEFYVLGDYKMSGLCGVLNSGVISNCSTKHGSVHTIGNEKTGICCVLNAGAKVENCSNYAKIGDENDGGYSSGIVYSTSGDNNCIIENCANYGEIVAKRHAGGILVGGNNCKISNCVNYGRITIEYHGGGIVAGVTNATLENCINYGEVNSHGADGGFVGVVHSGTCDIVCCKNYGKNTKAAIVGFIDPGNNNPATINIVGCDINVFGQLSLFGYQNTCSELVKINIKNCNINIKSNDNSYVFSCSCGVQMSIENVKISYENENYLLRLFASYNGDSLVNVNNLFITAKCNKMSISLSQLLNSSPMPFLTVDGVLFDIQLATARNKYYYGSNFNDYYVTWRTGVMGLVAFDGIGQFVSRLDENILQNIGFQKRTIA